jgi:phosphatidate phosphatase APP1
MRDDLSEIARSLGRGVGALKRNVDRRIGKGERPEIVAYRGYGNQQQAHVSGRVLRDPGLTRASAGDAWWRNLLNTYKRIETDELPGALVRITAFGDAQEIKSDEEGYLKVMLRVQNPDAAALWHPVAYELLSPRSETPNAAGLVLIPPVTARFGVISDLDDTVVRTDVHSVTRMVRAVAFSNAHTRLPFHGVAAFYCALHDGAGGNEQNPIFYVSSSPWNLYDLLDEFLHVRGIPAGPLLLRDWGLGVNPARNAPHKLAAIAQVLETYPDLPFILIGDSGQEDPEIYREVMARYPRRIRAAYIRNVTPQPERSARIRALIAEVTASGSSMVLADDTLAAARHAAENGWIKEEGIGAVAADQALEDEKGSASDSDADPANTLIVD